MGYIPGTTIDNGANTYGTIGGGQVIQGVLQNSGTSGAQPTPQPVTPQAIVPAPKLNTPTQPIAVATSNLAQTDLTNKQNYAATAQQAVQAQTLLKQGQDLMTKTQATIDKDKADKLALEQQKIDAKNKVIGAVTGGGDGTIPNATGTGVDNTQYQSDINGIQQQQIDNYTNAKTQLDQILRGTFPLSATEQSLVSAMQGSLDSAKASQELANKNYTAGITQSDIVGGLSRYSPKLAEGNIANAVNVGIQKLQDIDTKGIQALATLQEGFADKKYKQVTDSYNMLNGLLKDREDTITKMHDDVVKQESDLRDYNFKVNQANVENTLNSQKFTYQQKQDAIDNAFKDRQITEQQANNLRDYNVKLRQLEQGKYIVTTDAYGNPVAFNTKTGQFDKSVIPPSTVGQTGGKIDAYADAVKNAAFGMPPAQQKQALGQIKQQLDSGDTKRAQETLLRVALKNSGIDIQNQAMARFNAVDSLANIKNLLNVYVAKSGDTNILKGTIEQAANKIGVTSNPDLAKIGSQIQQAVQVYRRGMTGVAFSPSESAEYAKIFPDVGNVETLNTAKIDSLLESFTRQQKTFLSTSVGESNYDQIFGKPTGTPLEAQNIAPKIQQAIQSGYTPDEIVGSLSKDPTVGTQVQSALSSGYSADEILKFLNQ